LTQSAILKVLQPSSSNWLRSVCSTGSPATSAGKLRESCDEVLRQAEHYDLSRRRIAGIGKLHGAVCDLGSNKAA
jgi:hypothetical protein